MSNSGNFENIFSSFNINDLEIKNRIAMAPMGGSAFATSDGCPSDYYVNYLESRARGGVGMIITANTAVNDEQRMNTLGFYSPEMIPSFTRLVEAVKAYETRIFLQVAHLGGRALKSITGNQPVAPSSSIEHDLYVDQPRKLNKEEIRDLVDEFVQSAVWAQAAGFDGVELHAAHGHDLIGQFLSPSTNKREDGYGASTEGRVKFAEEILKGIKDSCGSDFPVGLKYNGYEALEDGVKLPEAKKIGKHMEDSGIDYLHIASMTLELDPSKYPSVSPLYAKSGALIDLASEIKESLDSTPVIGTGGINKPELAEEILENKRSDMLALGRALIADPSWANKVRKGETENIRSCIRCNECHKRIHDGKLTKCTVNPLLSWRGSQDRILQARAPQKVAVVGGGPAGIQAALVAEKKGHKVVLFEKREKIGGNLIPGTIPEFKQDLKMLLRYYKTRLSNSNISVKTGTEATPDLVLNENVDALILAVGAKHTIPDIPNIDSDHVVTAREVLDPHRQVELGNEIIVLGAGLVGCETAWYLSQQGKSVQLVEKVSLEEALSKEHETNRKTLLTNLANEDIEILDKTSLEKIKGKEFLLGKENGETEVHKADNLVVAAGFSPRKEIKDSFYEKTIDRPVYEIGDCTAPGNLFEAIQAARYTAEQI